MENNVTTELSFNIEVSKYYPKNCSEQNNISVSGIVLKQLEEFLLEDERYRNWERNHRAKGIYLDDEDYIAAIGFFDKSNECDVDMRVWLKNSLSNCSKTTVKRAIMHFIDGMSVNDIADVQSVHHSTISESINKAKKALFKMHISDKA